MNEFDFDVMQKKQLNASARKRVCGSKSRRCDLPSDHLTPAQLKAKSGPVVQYNLNGKMDYTTFKAMPHDLQQEYLSGLQERFNVGVATIDRELFGGKSNSLSWYMSAHDLKVRPGIRGRKMRPQEREVWERWLNGGEMPASAAQEDAVQEIVPTKDVDTPPAEAPQEKLQNEAQVVSFEVSELTATFTGEFDAIKFLDWLSRLPMPGGNVKIRVDVTKV